MIEFVGRHSSFALAGSPNRVSSASRTAKKSSTAQSTSWPVRVAGRVVGAGFDRRLEHLVGRARPSPCKLDDAQAGVNMNETELVSPIAPPYLLNADRTSDAVRLRLSVSASTITATPAGPYPS